MSTQPDQAGTSPLGELKAMEAVFQALEPLPAASRLNVVRWVSEHLKLSWNGGPSTKTAARAEDIGSEPKFDNFHELFERAAPKTDKQRVLVTAYWFQVCQGQQEFMTAPINVLLKDMGQPVSNITETFARLTGEKPAPVMQTKKTGSSKQARKYFRITRAGINAVREMMNLSASTADDDQGGAEEEKGE